MLFEVYVIHGIIRVNVCASKTFPFSTAVPFWGQTIQIPSSLSPKRDCGPKRVKIDSSNGWVNVKNRSLAQFLSFYYIPGTWYSFFLFLLSYRMRGMEGGAQHYYSCCCGVKADRITTKSTNPYPPDTWCQNKIKSCIRTVVYRYVTLCESDPRWLIDNPTFASSGINRPRVFNINIHRQLRRIVPICRCLPWGVKAALLRGTISNRTYGTHKNMHIYLFLPTTFGPIYYGPRWNY